MSGTEFDTEQEVRSNTREDVREPPMFKVLLHNDDYTTMEFVVQVLMGIFNKPIEFIDKLLFRWRVVVH